MEHRVSRVRSRLHKRLAELRIFRPLLAFFLVAAYRSGNTTTPLLASTLPQLEVPAPTSPDSDTARVIFSASGGTVTPAGLFTAGPEPGTFRVVASSPVGSDTSTVIVSGGSSNGITTGVPFGPFNAWNAAGLKVNTDVFTASIGSNNPRNILERIAVARGRGMKLILTMTGGAHANYMTDGVFDIAKWQTKMDAYNTPAITAAVETAVAEGIVIGNSVMDEPHVSGHGDGNTWGPRGTMTKERVDEMCAYVKNIFPTLPVGVVHPHKAFEPGHSYRVCDFLVDQYSARHGNVAEFRDQGLAQGRRDGIAIVFSMNILNGGTQAARHRSWDCPLPATGGRGTHEPNCRMSPEQVRDQGRVLGAGGCALMMWQYDDDFMANPDNQRAFADLAAFLAKLPTKSCKRS
jgi:hypothetical protein